jgi:hypothetical protein
MQALLLPLLGHWRNDSLLKHLWVDQGGDRRSQIRTIQQTFQHFKIQLVFNSVYGNMGGQALSLMLQCSSTSVLHVCLKHMLSLVPKHFIIMDTVYCCAPLLVIFFCPLGLLTVENWTFSWLVTLDISIWCSTVFLSIMVDQQLILSENTSKKIVASATLVILSPLKAQTNTIRYNTIHLSSPISYFRIYLAAWIMPLA